VRYAIASTADSVSDDPSAPIWSVTQPATSEEAQQAVTEWNARCVTRKVDPPVKVDGWVPAGELEPGCAPRMAGGSTQFDLANDCRGEPWAGDDPGALSAKVVASIN
jgi:hypothetical protein